MSFTELPLDEKILKAIQEMGYTTPTTIQKEAIPQIVNGHDLIASAQTGTGKTAAFMLPLLHHLLQNKDQRNGIPRILVLVPTRELAIQVASETTKFCKYLPDVKTICLFGGVPFPQQNKALSRRYEILVATPGRLLDHMGRGRLSLSKLGALVLDEADRMLDMGFVDDVKAIAAACPKTRQTLLFSATLGNNILSLSKELQNNPVQLRIKPDHSYASNIEQRMYMVDGIDHKLRILDHILENEMTGQTIIFTSTKRLADELADQLADKGHKAVALHGDINQGKRTRTFESMKKGTIQVLVATDVAARGIDVAKLSFVINFDLPMQAGDYIHRIGRTGRAGEKGIALTFVHPKERYLLAQIEQMTKQPMLSVTIPGLEPTKTHNSGGGKLFFPRRNQGGGRYNRSERKPHFQAAKPMSKGPKNRHRPKAKRDF